MIMDEIRRLFPHARRDEIMAQLAKIDPAQMALHRLGGEGHDGPPQSALSSPADP